VGQHLHRGIAVLHRRFDLHRSQFEHEHGFAHLAPVEVGLMGAGAAGGFVSSFIVVVRCSGDGLIFAG
jgi:hypothetical protein